jgi:hypothetical protein
MKIILLKLFLLQYFSSKTEDSARPPVDTEKQLLNHGSTPEMHGEYIFFLGEYGGSMEIGEKVWKI